MPSPVLSVPALDASPSSTLRKVRAWFSRSRTSVRPELCEIPGCGTVPDDSVVWVTDDRVDPRGAALAPELPPGAARRWVCHRHAREIGITATAAGHGDRVIISGLTAGGTLW